MEFAQILIQCQIFQKILNRFQLTRFRMKTYDLNSLFWKKYLKKTSKFLKTCKKVCFVKSIFLCPESQKTCIASVSKIIFLPIELKLFSAILGPRGLRNCNTKFWCVCLSVVCLSSVLMLESKGCHWPSDHSIGPICMKFSILVYLCDALRYFRRIFEFLIFSVFSGT